MAKASERKYIEDIVAGDTVEQAFLVADRDLRTSRGGSFYIDLELMDRTGTVSAKIWDASRQLFESFSGDDFVVARARSETYRGKLQLVVTHVRRLDPEKVDLAEFLPTTSKDIPTLIARLWEMAGGIRNAYLQNLLVLFLDDEAFMAGFQAVPGGVSIHHACLGGLLEHTVAMAELGLVVGERYPNVDGDLLLAGTILHDVGKVASFECGRGFRYTDAGGLIGHLPLGASMVEERAAQIEGFPQPLLELVLHLIFSHHGQYEYGSPVLPATAEAIALHYIDNLDAKLNAFELALLGDQDEETSWTRWNRIFDRRLFKGRVPSGGGEGDGEG